MGRITTHVLDTSAGRPAEGLKVVLRRIDGDGKVLAEAVTNADGRADKPLLEGDQFHLGTFELIFHVGEYFDRLGTAIEHQFLDIVPIRFSMGEETHYHVPLLVSPFGYSTYRGS